MRLSFPTLALASSLCVYAGSAAALSPLEDGDAAVAAGDFTQAAANYRAAVAEQPALAQDKAFMAKWTQAKAGANCEAAQRLMASGNGKAALGELEEAARLAPEWKPLQTLLPQAKKVAAEQWFAKARKSADAGQAAEAGKQLAAALELVPDHAKALAAAKSMDLATLQKAPKDSAIARALAAEEARDWAVAETAWLAAQKEDPSAFCARIGLAFAKAEQAKARQALEAARVARAAGRLEEAQVFSDKALAGWPQLPGAQIFHDDVALRREVAAKAVVDGDAAGQGAKWAAAEASYRKALAQDPAMKSAKAGLADSVERLAGDLVSRGRPGGALVACRRGHGVSQAVDRQAEALARQLQAEEVPGIQWKVTGDQADAMAKALAAGDKRGGKEPAPKASAAVAVRVVTVESKLAKTGSEAKSFAYFTEQEEANPEYHAIQVKLAGAEDRWNEAARKTDAAAKACGGHSNTCACAACAKWQGLNEQAKQWQQVVVDLSQERNQTAQTKALRQEHAYPYTEESWRATGKLVVEFTWSNGETLRRDVAFDKSDSVRIGAKPAIGLAEDKLELPDEKAIVADMAARLAEAAVPVAREQAILLRATMLKRAAKNAEKEGDADGALELRVRAAAMLGGLSPELAEKELKALE